MQTALVLDLLRETAEEHKEFVMCAISAYDESLRDQLYKEHGSEGWMQRYMEVHEECARRFVEKLRRKLAFNDQLGRPEPEAK